MESELSWGWEWWCGLERERRAVREAGMSDPEERKRPEKTADGGRSKDG